MTVAVGGEWQVGRNCGWRDEWEERVTSEQWGSPWFLEACPAGVAVGEAETAPPLS